MAIDSPIIAGRAAVQRRHAIGQPVTFDDGSTAPQYEGQVFFTYNVISAGGGSSRYSDMYVAIDINGTLTWVEVELGTFVDAYTGEPLDPMTFRSSYVETS